MTTHEKPKTFSNARESRSRLRGGRPPHPSGNFPVWGAIGAILAALIITPHSLSRAATPQDAPTAMSSSPATIPYLAPAIELGHETGLANITNISHTPEIRIIAGDESFAALAQYQPLIETQTPQNGLLTIGTNLKRYKQDYLYLSTIYDRSEKPDFDQYMTLFILLSLANESAHRQQHINGSLADYIEFKHQDNTVAACTLYALQQHSSDVLMLDNALRIETYFLGKGYAAGIRALHLVLERMDVKDAFDEMRSAIAAQDHEKLKTALHALYVSRLKANMAPRPECKDVTTKRLADRIYKRAIDPAKTIFAMAYTSNK